LEIGCVALRQRLYRQYCAPIMRKSRGKMSAAVRRAGTLEFLDKDVDYANGIVLAHPVF